MTQGGREVNRLFKADFFGERALLSNEPRGATVTAVLDTTCLVLDRDTFVELLGPLDAVMKEEKSAANSALRMGLLKPRGARPRAEVLVNVKTASRGYVKVVASGHLDEVQELVQGGTKMGSGKGMGVENATCLVFGLQACTLPCLGSRSACCATVCPMDHLQGTRSIHAAHMQGLAAQTTLVAALKCWC